MKTTREAAAVLGVSRGTLNKTVFRHPELRPKTRLDIGAGAYLWTDEEIEAVGVYYAGITTGRPRGEQKSNN